MQGDPTDSAPGVFWAFSLEFYGRPGVEAACLALQDEHGGDVNLALLALFLAARGDAVDAALAQRAREAAARWSAAVTAPLRAVRRGLARDGAEGDLRAALGRAELDAERILQDRLEALASGAAAGAPSVGNPPRDLALANLKALIGPADETEPARRLAALSSAGPDDPV